jgi:hypothetical protein
VQGLFRLQTAHSVLDLIKQMKLVLFLVLFFLSTITCGGKRTNFHMEINDKIAHAFMLIEQVEEEDQRLVSQFILQSTAILLYLHERRKKEDRKKERKRKREGDEFAAHTIMENVMIQTEKMVEQYDTNTKKRIKELRQLLCK